MKIMHRHNWNKTWMIKNQYSVIGGYGIRHLRSKTRYEKITERDAFISLIGESSWIKQHPAL